jgi:hypothetical protein
MLDDAMQSAHAVTRSHLRPKCAAPALLNLEDVAVQITVDGLKIGGRLISAKIARTLLSNTLKSVGLKKNGRTAKMLGYTFEELKTHIEAQFEPWMNWQNRGIGKNMWSIDHIIPVTVLLKLGIKDPSIINALWNLRPLSTEENIKRSNNIDKLAKTVAKEHLSIDLL